jgi:hypothetical protein
MIVAVLVLIMCSVFVLPIANAASDTILITISGNMNKVIFDGKWTTPSEWKSSSWSELRFTNSTIHLRVAHQDNFIYVFVDPVDDNALDKSDTTRLCIDSHGNKNIFSDDDDFCFVAKLGSEEGEVYQGNGTDLESSFTKISNPNGFIAVGGISDENDRYSTISHPSYEFRIPTELIGRSDHYGLFVSVFDEKNNTYYNWPSNLQGNTADIPSPQTWGELVSPDKSLPEFDLPLLILLPSLVLVFYLTRIRVDHEKIFK